MAKKQATKSKTTKSDVASKDVDIYEHKGSKRLNNPQVGLVNTKTEKVETKKTYKFDPHLDPQLQWSGKEEKAEFELPTVSLHVHERIDSRTIIEAVKKSPETLFEQLNLFNRPINKLNFVKEIQFYQHEKDWSNRLVAGDSLLVMNSLLEKEGMEGKIQVFYMDPPYGISYGSNFQPFVNNKVVKESDSDLTNEPEMLRAFRDTWELGIHSYLTFLRDRLALAKKLMTDEGSCFVQISDENFHFVRAIMDEIFGYNNFVCNIRYKTRTIPLASKLLDVSYDHIIWFAKDKSKMKFNKLFLEKSCEGDQNFRFIELSDGTRRPMSKEEHNNHKFLPKNSKVFAAIRLRPTQYRKNQDFNYEYRGKIFAPPGGNTHKTPNGVHSWSTTFDGMKNLDLANRLYELNDELKYVLYFDDYPVTPLGTIWSDTAAEKSKKYVVQTSEDVVSRCILMASNPGDLVFDPTCGSGTTAAAAERWGRRWITCDTSRVAITLAKSRLMTSNYEYFKLFNDEEGVASGFQYKTVPHITMGSVANREAAPFETLNDCPIIDTKKIRISGPFTVEAVPAPVVRELSGEIKGPSSITGPQDWISELIKTGIRLQNKKFLKLSRLEPMQGTKWLHAEGETAENPPQRIVVSFGSDFAPLEQRQVELALQEAEKLKPSPTVIVFAAFQFDPEAAKDIDEVEWGGVSVLKALMNADLFTEDLKKKRSSNESFWLVGQPDIDINKIKSGEDKGKYSVNVNGFDYYNTKSGTIESGGANKIAMWMLDTDYDGRSLLPKQVFFPQAGDNEGWAKLAKSLRAEIDEDLIEAYKGTESLPFEIGENKKIAVKIIDDRGIESLVVRDLE